MSAQQQSTGRASELRQVSLLSRHGVRAPLEEEIEYLAPFTNLPWPAWEVPPAHLSHHGRHLVELLGAWYGQRYRNLLTDAAPERSIYVRADSLERCVQTARHWLIGLLGEQEPRVPVHHLPVGETTSYDEVFLPVEAGMVTVSGLDQAIRGQICDNLQAAIQSLHGPLSLVQQVLGGPVFSPELYGEQNEIGDDGSVQGSLKIAQCTSDILVLQHANGWPIEKVGWGRIDRTGLLDIERARIFTDNLICRAPAYARADASNLLAHLAAGMEQLVSGDEVAALPFAVDTRLIAYFGHDTNIQTMGGLLDISWLPESFVQGQAPPACAQVLELHRDLDSGEHFVRLFFVSATLDQMVNATVLSERTPPGYGPIGLTHLRGLSTSLDIPYDELVHVVNNNIDLDAVSAELATWWRQRWPATGAGTW